MRKAVWILAGTLALVTAPTSAVAHNEHEPRPTVDRIQINGFDVPLPAEGHCPANFERAGEHFTYFPALMDEGEAASLLCGQKYELGLWRIYDREDQVTGDSIKVAYLYGRWLGEPDWGSADRPEMGVQCRDGRLGIFVYTGGYVGGTGRNDYVPVVYSIGDTQGVEQNWRELISGSDSSAGAWMADGYRAGFLRRMRANTTSDFTIRIFGYDGAAVGTAQFDLTGIELRVEPVLEACGW